MKTVVPRSSNGRPFKWCYNCKDFEEVVPCWKILWWKVKQVFLCLSCMEIIDYYQHLKQVPEIDNEY